MKVRRLNRQKQIKARRAAVNKKLKCVIFPQVNIISLLLLQVLAVIENYQYSTSELRIIIQYWKLSIFNIEEFYICSVRIIYSMELDGTFEFLQTFYELGKLVIRPFETCLWNCHHYYLKISKELAHGLSNFHPGLEKMSIIWKIWNFYPGLKFHFGLAIPSWNFYM